MTDSTITPQSTTPVTQGEASTVTVSNSGVAPVPNSTPLPPDINNQEVKKVDNQVKTSTAPNPTGKGGFVDNPQNINKAGRPKRKTIVEMVEERLEKEIPELKKTGHDAFVDVLVRFLLGSKGADGKVYRPDKQVILSYIQQRDGMPKQKLEHSGDDGEPLEIIIREAKNTNNE